MIIRPSNIVPIQTAQDSALALATVPIYQSREDVLADFKENVELVLPPADSNKPAKNWIFPEYIGAEDDGELVVYSAILVNRKTKLPILGPDGKPQIGIAAISKADAGRFNIGTGQANEFPQDCAYYKFAAVPFPVRPLHPDEELTLGFGSTVVLRNKRLAMAAPSLEASVARIEALITRIAKALNINIE